ncbi:unnamed protein product [Rangifer tarandus platyrhynchus]|uniref:Uncharacterized protein n=1 Tax=Rangifer tarandus platyrhynchus TaxID=3082113 RepID=A0ABN8ZTL0_RANTA|nr:unnamed protein product [Rangifer tarandus platyrhynchus]
MQAPRVLRPTKGLCADKPVLKRGNHFGARRGRRKQDDSATVTPGSCGVKGKSPPYPHEVGEVSEPLILTSIILEWVREYKANSLLFGAELPEKDNLSIGTIRHYILEVGDSVLYSTGPPERPGVSEAGEDRRGWSSLGWALLRCSGLRGRLFPALLPACCGHLELRLCAWRFRRELGSWGVCWAASWKDLWSEGPGARLLHEQAKPD